MEKNILRVGRDPACDIPIADDTISRFHAEIELRTDGKLFIVDCHSSNGTFIIRDGDEKRITQDTAAPGEQVRFGSCSFEVAELISTVKARAPRRQDRPRAPEPPSPAPDARRVRCEACGHVKLEGQTCPVCNAESRRIG